MPYPDERIEDGFNGLQIVALLPPEPRAVITVCSSDDRYTEEVHYMGEPEPSIDFLS